jgi:predicted MFS family arabinose efflux permease
MLGYGSFIGIIIVNFLSDYKGRRFSLLVALVVLIVSMARKI